jgi:hypothetical protein
MRSHAGALLHKEAVIHTSTRLRITERPLHTKQTEPGPRELIPEEKDLCTTEGLNQSRHHPSTDCLLNHPDPLRDPLGLLGPLGHPSRSLFALRLSWMAFGAEATS